MGGHDEGTPLGAGRKPAHGAARAERDRRELPDGGLGSAAFDREVEGNEVRLAGSGGEGGLAPEP